MALVLPEKHVLRLLVAAPHIVGGGGNVGRVNNVGRGNNAGRGNKHCIRDFCVQIISIDKIRSGKLANSDLK